MDSDTAAAVDSLLGTNTSCAGPARRSIDSKYLASSLLIRVEPRARKLLDIYGPVGDDVKPAKSNRPISKGFHAPCDLLRGDTSAVLLDQDDSGVTLSGTTRIGCDRDVVVAPAGHFAGLGLFDPCKEDPSTIKILEELNVAVEVTADGSCKAANRVAGETASQFVDLTGRSDVPESTRRALGQAVWTVAMARRMQSVRHAETSPRSAGRGVPRELRPSMVLASWSGLSDLARLTGPSARLAKSISGAASTTAWKLASGAVVADGGAAFLASSPPSRSRCLPAEPSTEALHAWSADPSGREGGSLAAVEQLLEGD